MAAAYYEARNVGRVPAAKLNAWSLSGDGATADLFVTLYHGSGGCEEVGLPETRRQFQLLRGFLRRALEGFHTKVEESSAAFRVMQQLHEARESLATVRLFFITDGMVRSLELDEEQFPGVEVRYVVWDLDKLSRLRVGSREVIELDLVNTYDGAIPCLKVADPTGEYQTFLAFFPAPLLARIYGEHGQRLLERNVRAFLQAKGKINRGLQRTLKEEPHRFLAYNNGLCCTAAEVRMNGGSLEWLRDFQIVNGGQTTASIYHAFKKERVDVSKVMVQVKLTVLKDPAMMPEIVPLISRYANSQNKVNGADFSANGPFHHSLERVSRTNWAPAASGLERATHWYYERARGSYLDDKSRAGTPAQMRAWERDHPLTQKFTKTDLAKFENSWDELPQLVSRGAEKNFAHWTTSKEDKGWPVADDQYFRRLVAKAILFRHAEHIVSAQEYPGYRANIVTYSLAWLVRRSGQRIDLDDIWRHQALSDKIAGVIDAVAYAARKHITNPPGGRNITEWCKRDDCWHDFREKFIELPHGWESELAAIPIATPVTEGENLQTRWEAIRGHFTESTTSVGELAPSAKVKWPANRWQHTMREYARLSWEHLQTKRAFGPGKQRALIKILEWAHEHGKR